MEEQWWCWRFRFGCAMYNLIEDCSNYSDTTSKLWFHSKDEATNFNADIVNNNALKSFEYKAKLLDNTVANGNHSILKKGNNWF